jgi:oligopeptide transport system substrate-binding protein
MTKSVAAIVLICLAGLTACSERAPSTERGEVTPTPDSETDGVVFRRGIAGEPDSLDPHRSEEASTADVLRDLYEGLTTESPDGKILPGVAERWEISGDGLVYRFFLRPDARWSNGDAVTAEDFVAGLRRSVDPLTGSSYSQVLDPIKNAGAILNGEAPVQSLGVVALEAQLLEITLKAPTPYFLGLLSHSAAYPIHGPSLETHGNGFARPGALISNGPFVLKEWVVQSHLKLTRNNFYWGATDVALDTVLYYSLEEPATELKRYQAGDLDFTELIPNARFKWIRENFGEELRVAPYLGIYYYMFNITRPPFDDVRLRQALNLAVDRQILTEKVTGVGELPAYGFVPPGVGGYEARQYSWAEWDEATRLELANSLYQAAGYSRDNPLRVRLYYNTGENHKKTAIAISSMWRQALGVETELVNEELRVLLDHRRDKSRWELMRLGWVGDYDDPNTFLEIMQTGHGQNDTGFADPLFDELLQEASRTLDPEKRMKLLAEAEQRLIEEYPVVPLYFYVTKRLVKPWVLGYTPGILDHNYSRDLSIDTNARGF